MIVCHNAGSQEKLANTYWFKNKWETVLLIDGLLAEMSNLHSLTDIHAYKYFYTELIHLQ